MKQDAGRRNPVSRVAIDTGGTFTDGTGSIAGSEPRTVKVLSSSALRGRVGDAPERRRLPVRLAESGFADDLLVGFTVRRPGGEDLATVVEQEPTGHVLLDQDVSFLPGDAVELKAPFDAPRLAMHLLLGTSERTPPTPSEVRVATTRGTNALLEGKGEPFGLLLDDGLEDLLEIGDQSRPDIFAVDIHRDRLKPELVRGIGGRLAADGTPDRPVTEDELDACADAFRTAGVQTVGIALAHAWRTPEREAIVAHGLRERGIENVICSTELSRSDQLLARAETVAVEATLARILNRFIDDILPGRTTERDRLSVMTSAGGLEPADAFRAKDGLLSGPAGGVAGAARSAAASGYRSLLGFDMGGTSTDVSRHEDDFIYRFETRVGPARIQAPCIAIETVAAGGGSICHVNDEGLAVGPRSAGASPGPACYGAGGPLTITDVNLLLGRGDPDQFDIPIEMDDAELRLYELRAELVRRGFEDAGREAVLEGLRNIADERMAEAMRSISIKEGADPRRHVLVPFGGAGGQHGCAIAERLEIETIMIPEHAGLLSAVGLFHARRERFAEQTVMEPLAEHLETLDGRIETLGEEARRRLDSTGAVTLRHIIALRLSGQDSIIQLDHRPGIDPTPAFRTTFESIYGYPPPDRPVELAWLRSMATEEGLDAPRSERLETPRRTADTERVGRMHCDGAMRNVPVHHREELVPGDSVNGPALIQDAGATIVVDDTWSGIVQPNGSIIVTRDRFARNQGATFQGADGAAAAELVSARLGAIATGMGKLLERTALSVNVKQRLDFSCAILDERGRLLVNAPHMPIHLGSMGICVRRAIAERPPRPGDIIVTNDPRCGGSHLPDVTTIAPVHEPVEDGRLLGYVAVRAHHAEIGGARPGSTPPFASHLVDEGVLIPPTLLVDDGQERFEDVKRLLEEAPWPSRRVEENLADLAAQVASTRHGVERLRELAGALGTERFHALAGAVHENAATAARSLVTGIGVLDRTVTQKLDDGALIRLHASCDGERLRLDFTGSAPVHPRNFNAPVAIVTGATVYLMRLLVDRPLPMNEGLLDPVDLVVPNGMINPDFCGDPTIDPAVCAGNTETSQRIVDTLLLAFELCASSQGTMNNLLMGDDRFGYYETICGGSGASPRSAGCSAVHTHMTNTRITDPETLESRYPVRLERFLIRRGSGGDGRRSGGDGVVRALRATRPLDLSLVTQHRVEEPYGLSGGSPGAVGSARVIRGDGRIEDLEGSAECRLEIGDMIEITTPGGGGWGSPDEPPPAI